MTRKAAGERSRLAVVLERTKSGMRGLYLPIAAYLLLSTVCSDGLITADPACSATVEAAVRSDTMSDDRFWEVIGRTTAHDNKPEHQLRALRSELENLSLREIEEFHHAFERTAERAYSYDLWGAAFVVHGGALDDGFVYFRSWLISKGRSVFEKVLANPDDLADELAPDTQGALEFEELAYVAPKVWRERSGRDLADMPERLDKPPFGGEPSGTQFEDEPDHLAAHYPKLWKRFGSNPL